MKTILILGAFGQLGQAWQDYFDTVQTDDIAIIPCGSSDLDITRPDRIKEKVCQREPDVIINCAAYTDVDQAEEETDKARQLNAKAVGDLAKTCQQHDIKLVHFSTDYVFAGLKDDQSRFPEGYPEDHPADPINTYGQTKWEGEQAIRDSECRHLIVRVSWLCGKHGSNFVKTMLELAQSHSSLDVIDNQIGSPTFADQLVKNVETMIKKGCEGTYHCSSKGKLSWAEFAEMIFDCSNRETSVKRISSNNYPTKAKRPFYSKLDTKKIEQIEGIETEYWKVGLGRLIAQLLN